VTVKDGITVTHSYGTFKITQNSTSPTSSTKTWARSQNMNDLPIRTISNGGTASWSSVLTGTYTVKALRSTASNCNGAWPGHGNYSWNYTVTFNG